MIDDKINDCWQKRWLLTINGNSFFSCSIVMTVIGPTKASSRECAAQPSPKPRRRPCSGGRTPTSTGSPSRLPTPPPPRRPSGWRAATSRDLTRGQTAASNGTRTRPTTSLPSGRRGSTRCSDRVRPTSRAGLFISLLGCSLPLRSLLATRKCTGISLVCLWGSAGTSRVDLSSGSHLLLFKGIYRDYTQV